MFAGDETKPVEQRDSGVLRELEPAHLLAQLQGRWAQMTFADAKYVFDNVKDTGPRVQQRSVGSSDIRSCDVL